VIKTSKRETKHLVEENIRDRELHANDTHEPPKKIGKIEREIEQY